MLARRHLLLSLAALPAAAHAARAARSASWRQDVGELRFGSSGNDAVLLARALQDRLGVTVRPVRAQGGSLARELDRGHIEFALLDRATLSNARSRMHRRLVAGPIGADGRTLVMRSVLPAAMRADLAAAFA